MSQSTLIVGGLLIGFFAYVTVRGSLGKYLGLMGI